MASQGTFAPSAPADGLDPLFYFDEERATGVCRFTFDRARKRRASAASISPEISAGRTRVPFSIFSTQGPWRFGADIREEVAGCPRLDEFALMPSRDDPPARGARG